MQIEEAQIWSKLQQTHPSSIEEALNCKNTNYLSGLIFHPGSVIEGKGM